MEARTIVTWVWHGERAYTLDHAVALSKMLKQRMRGEYRFVVIADEPGWCPDAEVVETPPEARRLEYLRSPEGNRFPTCYRRLWLFSDAAKRLGSRILLTDVDVAVVNDWSPLFDYDADFVGWQPGQSWGNTERRLAGGMWLLRTGTHTEVWNEFVAGPETAIRLARKAGYRGSDQAWISYKLLDEAVIWPLGSGVYSVRDLTRDKRSSIIKELPDDARVVHFNGPNNPWERETWLQHPWLANNWPVSVV